MAQELLGKWRKGRMAIRPHVRLSLTGARLLLSLAFVAEFTARGLRRLLVIVTRRPIRAVATPVPSVVPFSFSVGHNMPLSRETCKMCWRANPVGFAVPDDVWQEVVPSERRSDVVCISCFARLADEKLIPWDDQIQLYPVSLATHQNQGASP